MSPRPWVRVHAIALLCVLIAEVVLGGQVFALGCSVAITLFGFYLCQKYQGDLAQAGVTVPPHREALDILVAGDARAAILPPLTLAAYIVAIGARTATVAPYVLAATSTLAIVVVVVYASSLCDWYLILPRLSGLLGPRPCRLKGEPATWPATWREVTRWWYIHRIVADFVLVYGLALALGIVVAGVTGASSPWVDLALTMVLGTFGAYKKALWPAVKEAGHPRLILGRTVNSRFGERRDVSDVAIEGVQLVPADKYEARAEQMRPDEAPDFEKDPERLPLEQIDEAGDAVQFSGCERRCVGISWYCIENHRCFEVK
jgi:hypothetical protein